MFTDKIKNGLKNFNYNPLKTQLKVAQLILEILQSNSK